MADITDLINYYANLLIIQYHNKPKAQATIALFAKVLLADGVFQDVMNGYDLETAIGKQLDVIGKYHNVDRFYNALDLENYFSLTDYIEILPSSPPRWGFSDYTTFDDPSFNGTLVYGDILTSLNALSDDDFRTLLRLAIRRDNMNFSDGEIDQAVADVLGSPPPDATFGSPVRVEDNGNMIMTYFFTAPLSTLVAAIIFKNILPKPMGVGIRKVMNVTGQIFGFADYAGADSIYAFGFSDYADYDSLPGQVLTYAQIS